MIRSTFDKNYKVLLKSTPLSRLKLSLEKSISMISLSIIIYPQLLSIFTYRHAVLKCEIHLKIKLSKIAFESFTSLKTFPFHKREIK